LIPFRLAVNSSMASKIGIDKLIKIASEIGYTGIELSAEKLPWADPIVSPAIKKEERKYLLLKIKKAGLKIYALAAHSSFVCSDPEERKANLEYMHDCIELAKDFEAPVVHFISGSCPNNININDAWNWLVDGLSDLIEHCKITGCLPGFEAVVNQLIATSDDLTKLTANFDNQLGIVYDPSHFQLYGEDLVSIIKKFKNKIIHVHLKDAKGKPEDFSFPPLGQGDIPFEKVFESLKEINYNGAFSVEYEGNYFGNYLIPVDEIISQGYYFCSKLYRKTRS